MAEPGRQRGGNAHRSIGARVSSRYGIAITSEQTAKRRHRSRRRLFSQRATISTLSLLVAAFGTLCAVASSGLPDELWLLDCAVLYVAILATIVLLALITLYHLTEAKIELVDTGSDYLQSVITTQRVLRLAIELVICAVCPIPGLGSMQWKNVSTVGVYFYVPINTVLRLAMVFRLYLLYRFFVLHSQQFQNAGTRTIAALNRIAVDVKFVLKTKLNDYPFTMICSFTLGFWLVVTFMMAECERYAYTGGYGLAQLLDHAWFVVVTFFSCGYGDLVPRTYCGRTLAISSSFVGAFVSSVLIAVTAQLIRLSLPEIRVNRVIAESQLAVATKKAAASLLFHTWRLKRVARTGAVVAHRRRLYQARVEFRQAIRLLHLHGIEQYDDLLVAGKLQHDVRHQVARFHRRQRQLIAQLAHLAALLANLQRHLQLAGRLPVRHSLPPHPLLQRHGHKRSCRF